MFSLSAISRNPELLQHTSIERIALEGKNNRPLHKGFEKLMYRTYQNYESKLLHRPQTIYVEKLNSFHSLFMQQNMTLNNCLLIVYVRYEWFQGTSFCDKNVAKTTLGIKIRVCQGAVFL